MFDINVVVSIFSYGCAFYLLAIYSGHFGSYDDDDDDDDSHA
jgi:hypothetical protein